VKLKNLKPKIKKAKPFHIAIDLLSGIMVGFFLGMYLDKALGTQPLFILIFSIIGVIASMKNLYREVSDG
jgi:ATP synthase protein I